MPTDDFESVARAILAGGESYYAEFKTCWEYGPEDKKPRDITEVARDIGQAVAGFANSEGGDLLVGVEDAGRPTGVPWEAERLDYLLQAPRHQIKLEEGAGQIGVRVYEVTLDGYRTLLFRIAEYAGPPVVTADGRCVWRRGVAFEPVPPAEIERKRRRRRGDTAYETESVPEATLQDIDLALVRRGSRLRTFPPGEHDMLRYWNLVDVRNGTVILRRAALLLFAREPLRWHPNNRIRIRRLVAPTEGFGRHLGTRETDVLGPIAKALPEAIDRLRRQFEVDTRQENLFTTTQLLPREAVEECIVNAVAHRNYAIDGSAVEVVIYPDRVEFKSPGGLPEPIRVEDLLKRRGVHRSRNPVIMRVLRDLGWSRDQGEGMRRIFGAVSQVELHEPELEEMADTFIVRLSTRSLYDDRTRGWLAAYGPFGLEPHERRYLVQLQKAKGSLSSDRLARAVSESFDETKNSLVRLERKGFVWHATKGRTYHLVAPLSVPHELALRALHQRSVVIGVQTILDRQELRTILSPPDDRSFEDLVARWKESGVLVPGGKGRWKLGPSFLAYSHQRGRAASAQ